MPQLDIFTWPHQVLWTIVALLFILHGAKSHILPTYHRMIEARPLWSGFYFQIEFLSAYFFCLVNLFYYSLRLFLGAKTSSTSEVFSIRLNSNSVQSAFKLFETRLNNQLETGQNPWPSISGSLGVVEEMHRASAAERGAIKNLG
jgi:hypothetical protein